MSISISMTIRRAGVSVLIAGTNRYPCVDICFTPLIWSLPRRVQWGSGYTAREWRCGPFALAVWGPLK